MKLFKKVIAIFLIATSIFLLLSCNKDENGENTENQEDIEEMEDEMEQNPRVEITLWDDRKIRLELYPEDAPVTVANFLELVDNGYYSNTVFHRIISDFMIQAGMLEYDESLKYKPTQDNIVGEFDNNGHPNPIKHELGVISMARARDMDSASAQFFICSATASHLDGDYAAFGKTIDDESNQVVLQLSYYPTETFSGMDDFPLTPNGDYVIIRTIERLEDE
ncbi:MAG: peptidylprolyl isomerase [Bacillota bacterium]